MLETTFCGFHQNIDRRARLCVGLWLVWVLGLEEYGVAGSTFNVFNKQSIKLT
jgi:hypothetical protein